MDAMRWKPNKLWGQPAPAARGGANGSPLVCRDISEGQMHSENGRILTFSSPARSRRTWPGGAGGCAGPTCRGEPPARERVT